MINAILIIFSSLIAITGLIAWAAITVSKQWTNRDSKKALGLLQQDLEQKEAKINSLEKRLTNVEHIVADVNRLELNRPEIAIDFQKQLEELKAKILNT
jgi:uncharacterized protein involved in exopolysaccharide biosynthesis